MLQINPNTTLDFGSVVVAKLINGDEVIGILKSWDQTTDTYTFDTPVVMQLVPAGNGQAQVVFAPFLMGIDDGVLVDIQYSKMLIRPLAARQDAGKQYRSATSKLDLSAATSI